MVLEETLVFGDAGDADRFVSYLKAQGVRARRRVLPYITEAIQVRGPLSGLIDWVNAEIEERRFEEEHPDPNDEGDDEEFEPDTFGDPPDISERFHLNALRDNLNRQYVTLSQALDGKSIGDPVAIDRPFTGEDLPVPVVPDEKLLELLGELDHALVRENLIRSGVVEETENGLRLVRTVSPGDIEFVMGVPDIDVTPELVDAHGVLTEFHIHFETEYAVECEGAIHLACTPDDVERALIGTSVTPESLDDLVHSFQAKAQVIGSALEVIEREKRASLESVVAELCNNRVDTDSSAVVVLDPTPEFVRVLIDDLRKAGAITGNDRKLRRA
jgi:hypothetical protein